MQMLSGNPAVHTGKRKLSGGFRKNSFLYILILPSVILTFIFAYLPMPGILAAFKDYDLFRGLYASPWVGLKHIKEIFQVPELLNSILNTFQLSVLTILIGFPAPIILALLLNELKNGIFKRTVQTISYLPHFLSWISVVGIIYALFAPYGPVNDVRIMLLGENTERVMFLSKQNLFIPFVLLAGVWKEVGWGTIVYLAALTSIDPQLYEAAVMDGAGKIKQMIYITLPGIKVTAVILLIFNLGTLFKSNFELVYGLQNAYINYDVISTIVYTRGIQQGNISMAAALGFMEGLVAFVLTVVSNTISKKVSDIGIW
jgi:putative aldouronate transport system permease protein